MSSTENATSPSAIYDKRYSESYREHLTGYEVARWKALEHFIASIVRIRTPQKVLDYGAGSGLYAPLWISLFPSAELNFCDISSVAMEKFKAKYPQYADGYHLLVEGQAAAFPDNSFDVVVSVEVMEHVRNIAFYLQDIHRLLKPGGYFIWTTPCANRFSIEHVFSSVTGQIEPTHEGYRRWTWEEPTHIRRLRSREIKTLLKQQGFSDIRLRFRAHFFSFLCTYLPTQRALRLREKLMSLDYTLLRNLPNGASMIGGAQKAC